MECTQEGRVYRLNHYVDDNTKQEIAFMKKENGILIYNGTTNEEVLAMLIDRMKYLNTKCACRENSIVITKLEESLMWLNKRTELRVAQGIEGLNIPHQI